MKQIRTCLIISILFWLSLSGCKRDPIPAQAIPRDRFVDILVDVHLAEAISNDRSRYNLDSLNPESFYLSVLNKHQVTEEQMKITTLYYSRHPRDFDKIYSKVLSRLSQMNEEPESQNELKVR